MEYNYQGLTELGREWLGWSGEMHGLSAFLRRGDRVFHTSSNYARGADLLVGTYDWLDLTARVRQEDWEQPPRRNASSLMGWLRHHDRYGTYSKLDELRTAIRSAATGLGDAGNWGDPDTVAAQSATPC